MLDNLRLISSVPNRADVPGRSRRKPTKPYASQDTDKRLSRPRLPHPARRPIPHRQACSFPFRYICPELYRKQGKAKLHRSLQTPRAPGQRPRFDAASPSRHSGCRIRMLFMDTLAHPITNQRYSPHTHGKCTEKASFFIPTNRQRRKGCDKKEVIE